QLLSGAVVHYRGRGVYSIDVQPTQPGATIPALEMHLEGRDLHVSGTAGDDQIVIDIDQQHAVVQLKRSAGTWIGSMRTSQFHQIIVDGNRGNDEIVNLTTDPTMPSIVVYGGAGDDLVLAGPAGDRIYGGDGNDAIDAGDGRDTV